MDTSARRLDDIWCVLSRVVHEAVDKKGVGALLSRCSTLQPGARNTRLGCQGPYTRADRRSDEHHTPDRPGPYRFDSQQDECKHNWRGGFSCDEGRIARAPRIRFRNSDIALTSRKVAT